MSRGLYNYWVDFFRAAGIVAGFDTSYAAEFSVNHIQPDMVTELDHDMFKGLGVKAVGDRFAIIRHANFICEKLKLAGITGIDAFIADDKIGGSDDEEEEVCNPRPPDDYGSDKNQHSPSIIETGSPSPSFQLVTTTTRDPEKGEIIDPEEDRCQPKLKSVVHVITPSASIASISPISYSNQPSSSSHRSQPSHSTSTPTDRKYRQNDSSPSKHGRKTRRDRRSCSNDRKGRRKHAKSTSPQPSISGSHRRRSDRYRSPTPRGNRGRSGRRRSRSLNRSVHSSSEKKKYRSPTPERVSRSFGGTSQPSSPQAVAEAGRVKRVFLYDLPEKPKKVDRRRTSSEERIYEAVLPMPNPEAASMDDPIEGDNRGYQMMTKMGWNAGKGLGSGNGIRQPIRIVLREGRKGLGAERISGIDDRRSKRYTSFVSTGEIVGGGA